MFSNRYFKLSVNSIIISFSQTVIKGKVIFSIITYFLLGILHVVFRSVHNFHGNSGSNTLSNIFNHVYSRTTWYDRSSYLGRWHFIAHSLEL